MIQTAAPTIGYAGDAGDAPGSDPTRSALALDVGGTKMAAALVTDDGRIVAVERADTPPAGNAEELFAALTRAADAVLARLGFEPGRPSTRPTLGGAGIGLATAAPLELAAGTVSPVNIPGWRDFPLRDRLAQRYGMDVHMIGDAVAVAVGEHWQGAARGHRNVLGMVVSTGVGGGVLIDGVAVSGATGNAGQIGHISVDPDGPDCVCGGRGCLEAIASGRSIAAWAAAHGRPGIGDARAVADAAQAGDEVALAAFRRAGEAVGLAVASAVTLLDLDVVVIGGGVARAGALLFDPIAVGYARFAALDYARAPRVVPAVLGTEAGLVGAAATVLPIRTAGQNGVL